MTRVVDQVIYTGVLAGDPPWLLFQKTLGQSRSSGKVFTEAVPIQDAQLLRQIQAELQLRDRIELTVEYDYTLPGLPSEGVGYRRVVAASLPQSELTAA